MIVTVVVTVAVLGGLTAGVGVVIQDSASTVHTEQMATAFADAFAPAKTVGHTSAELTLEHGSIYAAPRRVRLLTETKRPFTPGRTTVTVVETVRSDAIVYARNSGQIVVHAGAVYYGRGTSARIVRPPEITAHGVEGPTVLGVPAVQTDDIGISVTPQKTVQIDTTVTHRQVDLGQRPAYLTIETADPKLWQRYFADQEPTVITTRARFEGDQEDSVVVRLPEGRPLTLVIHEVEIEVTTG